MRVTITITTTMSVFVLQPKAMLKSSWHPMTSPKLPMIVTKAPFPAAPSSTAFAMMAKSANRIRTTKCRNQLHRSASNPATKLAVVCWSS